jgi:ribose 1,5-bisphosphokinase PhnN
MTDLPTFLFHCLQTSPSYLLAHRIAIGDIARDDAELPSQFDDVERTYGLCGPVYLMDFEDWWEVRGSRVFEAGAIIPQKLRMRPTTRQGYLLAVQLWALARRLQMRGRKSGKREVEDFQLTRPRLLLMLGTGIRYIDEGSLDVRRSVMADPATKKLLGTKFDARLQQGFRLVENAARGRIPSIEKLPPDLVPSKRNREEQVP